MLGLRKPNMKFHYVCFDILWKYFMNSSMYKPYNGVVIMKQISIWIY